MSAPATSCGDDRDAAGETFVVAFDAFDSDVGQKILKRGYTSLRDAEAEAYRLAVECCNDPDNVEISERYLIETKVENEYGEYLVASEEVVR
ncbi:hypothetical protein B4589_009835 [Halolamina sp. CBA1230]|uniref:hypothetical protein n=1 Tax=Halolamina sp. CBA1230 TaxID=1853690 RepID=UPI0009A1953C|nr:hypothetical protein [Halolamina sp. CBA1230]QKY20664.1 hypothetical protein B4589_009835 [Halolamina sp. CBA1230]